MVFSLDESLIQRLVQQDSEAFTIFYTETVDHFFRYLHMYYYVSEAESQDILSDFYTKFRTAVTKYDGRTKFSYYMRTIFKNTIKDFFKKRKDIPFTQLQKGDIHEQEDDYGDYFISDEDIEALLQKDFTYEAIMQAMQSLPHLDQEIVFLKFVEDKNSQEIAETLQISPEAVRKRLSRAIQHLRDLLEKFKD